MGSSHGFSSHKDPSPIEFGPHVYDLTLITSLKALSANIVTMGVRTSTYTFEGAQFNP